MTYLLGSHGSTWVNTDPTDPTHFSYTNHTLNLFSEGVGSVKKIPILTLPLAPYTDLEFTLTFAPKLFFIPSTSPPTLQSD